jgi:[ribosomal protein S18]-alanine N-acetyltransferase
LVTQKNCGGSFQAGVCRIESLKGLAGCAWLEFVRGHPQVPNRFRVSISVSRYNSLVFFSIREFRKDDFETLWRIDQQCFAPGISYSRLELAAYMKLAGSFTLIAESGSASGARSPEVNVGDPKASDSGTGITPGTESTSANHLGIMGFVVGNANRFGNGHIITIDVLPGRQRAGVGSGLLEACEKRLLEAGCKFVRLETAVNNTPALSFYKRHGYFLVRTLRNYYPDGSDALVLRKELLSPPGDR